MKDYQTFLQQLTELFKQHDINEGIVLCPDEENANSIIIFSRQDEPIVSGVKMFDYADGVLIIPELKSEAAK